MSGANIHLINWLLKVEFDTTQNLKMRLGLLRDQLGHMLSDLCYRTPTIVFLT
jgi:hypothetical protein